MLGTQPTLILRSPSSFRDKARNPYYLGQLSCGVSLRSAVELGHLFSTDKTSNLYLPPKFVIFFGGGELDHIWVQGLLLALCKVEELVHTWLFRAYFWLSAKGLLLAGLGRPYGVSGITSSPACPCQCEYFMWGQGSSTQLAVLRVYSLLCTRDHT